MLLPSFLNLPVYAVDLSDESFKYLLLKKNRHGVIVKDFGEGPIAKGVIERGEIKKKDILTALLKELFYKKNIRYVAFSLPEEKGFSRNVKLEGVKKEEIEEALTLQLEEYVPLPPSEVIFDWTLAETEKDHLDVILNAFPKTLVESYLDVFYAAGALPVKAESELSVLATVILPKTFKGAAMIMDWGKTRTGFAIVENSALKFASTVPIGGNHLNEAIAKALNIDLVTAENLKKQGGFVPNQNDLAVFQAIVPIVTALREEAEKYINFWQTHSEKKESVSQIFLSGGDANLLGLKDYLSKELGIPVNLSNPWINIKMPRYYLPELERGDSVRFTAAIGLAISALAESNEL